MTQEEESDHLTFCQSPAKRKQCNFAQGNKQKVGTLKQVRVSKNTAQTA